MLVELENVKVQTYMARNASNWVSEVTDLEISDQRSSF